MAFIKNLDKFDARSNRELAKDLANLDCEIKVSHTTIHRLRKKLISDKSD